MGPCHDWVKVTCAQRETLPIAGFAVTGSSTASILVGARARTWSMPARSTTALTSPQRSACRRAAEAANPQNPALLQKDRAQGDIWVEPELLAEIEYRTKSAEGKVRHPFFKGLREGL